MAYDKYRVVLSIQFQKQVLVESKYQQSGRKDELKNK